MFLVKGLKLLHHLLQDGHVIAFPGSNLICHELPVYMSLYLSVFVWGLSK